MICLLWPLIYGVICGIIFSICKFIDDSILFAPGREREHQARPEEERIQENLKKERWKIDKAFNDALSDAKTREDRVALADLISEFGYKNTGQLILVPKNDGRALVFDAAEKGFIKPESEWKMTLKSHPGRAIVRGDDTLIRHDGEQAFLGFAKDAHTVKMDEDGKYIHSVDKSDFWLEIPRNQHDINKAMWFRTKHSSNDDYFGWIVNENGTISSMKNSELVLGYGISPNRDHW